MPIIPELWKLSQENCCKLLVSLGSILPSSKSNSSELKHTATTKAQNPGPRNNNKSRDKVFIFSKFIIYKTNYVKTVHLNI